jgi:hypothetical protein
MGQVPTFTHERSPIDDGFNLLRRGMTLWEVAMVICGEKLVV